LGLLVDTSMSQRRVLGDEQRAAYKFVDQVMTQKDQSFVIHFDRDVELLQDLTNSRQKLEKSLNSLDTPRQLQRDPQRTSGRRGGGGGGGTALYDAVLLASNEVIRDQPGRKAIIILSDGVDNGSKVGLTDAIDAAQRNDVLVYSILFSDEAAYGGAPPMVGGHGRMGAGRPRPNTMPRTDEGKKVLERLSKETGGGFFEVSKKQPLDRSFAQIQDELRNQYSLGFTSDPPAAPGSFRRLLVTTPKQKNLLVQARDGYYAK
jgi:VWFA-related protein